MNIIIHSIDYSGSIVDGPGIRTVLFIQGCEQKCVGCHNPATWDIKKGKTIPVKDLISELRKNVLNRKLTISGGEPLLQYPAVLELVKGLTDFIIVLYTGLEFNEVPKDILKYLTYIKVGKYMSENHSTTISYSGSSNQRFIHLLEAAK